MQIPCLNTSRPIACLVSILWAGFHPFVRGYVCARGTQFTCFNIQSVSVSVCLQSRGLEHASTSSWSVCTAHASLSVQRTAKCTPSKCDRAIVGGVTLRLTLQRSLGLINTMGTADGVP
jgi:hypothetical protein